MATQSWLVTRIENILRGHETLLAGELEELKRLFADDMPEDWMNALRVHAAGPDLDLPALSPTELECVRDLMGFPSWPHVHSAAHFALGSDNYDTLVANKHKTAACKLAFLYGEALKPTRK